MPWIAPRLPNLATIQTFVLWVFGRSQPDTPPEDSSAQGTPTPDSEQATPPQPPSRLGTFLRDLRHAAHLDQRAWADQIGVRQNTVISWEHGRTIPRKGDLKLVIALAHDIGAFEALARTEKYQGCLVDGALLRALVTDQKVTPPGTRMTSEDDQVRLPETRPRDRPGGVIALVVAVIVVGLLVFAVMRVAVGDMTTDLAVSLDDPSEGATVTQIYHLSGAVSDPRAMVRILIYPAKGGSYWVQNPPYVNEKTGAWDVEVNFGDEGEGRGRGESFVVIVLAARQSEVLGALVPTQELQSPPSGPGIQSTRVRVLRPI